MSREQMSVERTKTALSRSPSTTRADPPKDAEEPKTKGSSTSTSTSASASACPSTPAGTKRKARPNSLTMTMPPRRMPIPPSLAASPHLLSPHSMFRRNLNYVPRPPSQQEEEWLGDTVPIPSPQARSPHKGQVPLAPSKDFLNVNSAGDTGRARGHSVSDMPAHLVLNTLSAQPMPTAWFEADPTRTAYSDSDIPQRDEFDFPDTRTTP